MMETMYSNGMCRCCASEGTFKDLSSKYRWMGVDETYADMLRECFDVTLTIPEDSPEGGICEVCITQLRNAANFKKQVLSTEEQFKRMLQNKSFKSNIVKVEVNPPDDDIQFTDEDNNLSNDDFSSTEYEVPIKTETEEGKSRKRSAKPGPSRAKQPKLEAETSKPMLFKVIKTIHSGKYVLAIVPDIWERDGTLHWPTKHEVGVLNIGDILNPGDEWKELDCIVEREDILSYNDALKVISNKDNTDNTTESDKDALLANQKRKPPDLIQSDKTDIADTETNHNPSHSSTSNGDPRDVIEASVKDDYQTVPAVASTSFIETPLIRNINSEATVFPSAANIIENPNSTSMLAPNTCVVNTIHSTNNPTSLKCNTSENTANIDYRQQQQENERINRKLDDLTAKVSTILENQNIMSLNQGALSHMFEQFMKLHASPTEKFKAEENSVLDFKIIENVKELEELEERLKDPTFVQGLRRKFSLISSRDDGSGVNVAYKLIDIMFSREFLTHCSWSGGSRQDNVKKICFKMFQRTIELFFSVIRESDHLFTLDDCEKFIKLILRNSKTRSQGLNIRRSTKKHRTTRRERENRGSDDEEQNTVERLIRNAIAVEIDPCANYE